MILSPQQLLALVEKRLSETTYGERPAELYEPISYIMGLGGKRIRPVLALLSYSLYKDKPADIISQALSVELFHNFTLVHDDIMDQAPLRRGKATVHEKWNTNIAILSGDTMLVKVYDLLLEDLKTEHTQDLIRLFNAAAVKVCEGQQLDMNFEQRETVTQEEYIEMIRLKTAELLAFSLSMGALLAGRKDQIEGFNQFGNHIGIGFQLKDDLLDAFGGEGFGKQVGGDIISRKKTFLTLRLLELAQPKDKKRILQLYGPNPGMGDDERVYEIIKLYDKYEIRNHTEVLMNRHFDLGFAALKKIDAPLNRKAVLRAFAEALIDRQT